MFIAFTGLIESCAIYKFKPNFMKVKTRPKYEMLFQYSVFLLVALKVVDARGNGSCIGSSTCRGTNSGTGISCCTSHYSCKGDGSGAGVVSCSGTHSCEGANSGRGQGSCKGRGSGNCIGCCTESSSCKGEYSGSGTSSCTGTFSCEGPGSGIGPASCTNTFSCKGRNSGAGAGSCTGSSSCKGANSGRGRNSCTGTFSCAGKGSGNCDGCCTGTNSCSRDELNPTYVETPRLLMSTPRPTIESLSQRYMSRNNISTLFDIIRDLGRREELRFQYYTEVEHNISVQVDKLHGEVDTVLGAVDLTTLPDV